MAIFVFFISAAVGAGQVALDALLYPSIFGKNYVRALVIGCAKLALYGLFLFLLFRVFRAAVTAAAIGYFAGFFPLLTVYCVIRLKSNK